MENKNASVKFEALSLRAFDSFSKMALISASRVTSDLDNPLRFNQCCASIRILFEHIVGTLAPNDEVKNCKWYAPVEGREEPVRAQRIQYWIQGGLSDEYVSSELGIDMRPLRKRLLTAFDKLSKHVHARQDTILHDPIEIEAEQNQLAADIEELLDAYASCRLELMEPLLEALDEGAVDSLMAETIDSLDELATHHYIEEIYTGHTEVEAITSSAVRYRTTGSISATLQWGSNSDMRNDIGAQIEKSFPFGCSFEVPIEDPRDLSFAEIVSAVDTSEWWGSYYDEDDPR